jgi:hypothetical protein
MPSFSVPGLSIGMRELELLLKEVHEGTSRYAAQHLLAGAWQSEKYIYRFFKRMNTYCEKAKAIFPEAGDSSFHGLDWIESVVGKTQRPIFLFNGY